MISMVKEIDPELIHHDLENKKLLSQKKLPIKTIIKKGNKKNDIIK